MTTTTTLHVTLSGATADELKLHDVGVQPLDRAADAEPTDLEFLETTESPGRHVGRVAPGTRRIVVLRNNDVLVTRDVELRDGYDITVEISLGD